MMVDANLQGSSPTLSEGVRQSKPMHTLSISKRL